MTVDFSVSQLNDYPYSFNKSDGCAEALEEIRMNAVQFLASSPGKLVPSSVVMRKTRAGLPEAVSIECKAFVPDPLPPRGLEAKEATGLIAEDLLEAVESITRLDEAVTNLPNPTMLVKALRRREAQRSSEIENTVATIEEVAMVEVGQPPRRSEVIESSNNIKAIESAINSALPPCTRWIRDAHRALLEGTEGSAQQTPGEFRTHQNWIGKESHGFPEGCRFVPPPPGEPLAKCLGELEQAMNEQSKAGASVNQWHWLIQLAMIHYQFEAIHPFRDGNGRVGRLLVNVLPCKWRVLRHPIAQVSDVFADDRETYYDALLGVSTRGDWVSWIRLFCRAISRQAANDLQRARRLATLRTRYRSCFAKRTEIVLAHQMIDLLFNFPAMVTTMAEHFLKVSFPTAQKYLNKMVDHGIADVREMSSARLYIAREVLQTLSLPIEQLPKDDESHLHDER